MARIAARKQNSLSRGFTGFALMALASAAIGAGIGWTIGHQTRGDNHAASMAQSAPRPEVSVSNPVAVSVPVGVDAPDVAPATIKGGMAETIDTTNALAPVAGPAASVTSATTALPQYVYLVGSQEAADTLTQQLLARDGDHPLGYHFVVWPAGTEQDQTAAYTEIQMLSGIQNLELHVVDMRG